MGRHRMSLDLVYSRNTPKSIAALIITWLRCITVLVRIELVPLLPPKVYEISGGYNFTGRTAERFPFEIAFTFRASLFGPNLPDHAEIIIVGASHLNLFSQKSLTQVAFFCSACSSLALSEGLPPIPVRLGFLPMRNGQLSHRPNKVISKFKIIFYCYHI
jgi:hypothetical protein